LKQPDEGRSIRVLSCDPQRFAAALLKLEVLHLADALRSLVIRSDSLRPY